jgi:soluble lytic murein transglycosylase-like protein
MEVHMKRNHHLSIRTVRSSAVLWAAIIGLPCAVNSSASAQVQDTSSGSPRRKHVDRVPAQIAPTPLTPAQIVIGPDGIARSSQKDRQAGTENGSLASAPIDITGVERPDLARPGLSALSGPAAGLAATTNDLQNVSAPASRTTMSVEERRRLADDARARLPGQQATSTEVRGLIVRISRALEFSERFALIIAETESKLDPFAVSETGAVGVMQLMPDTARDLGIADPFALEANVRGGIRHLKWFAAEFPHPLLVAAAYHAGPERVRAANGIPPTPRTAAYVVTVLNRYYDLMAADASVSITDDGRQSGVPPTNRTAQGRVSSPRDPAPRSSRTRTAAALSESGGWERGFVLHLD